MARRSDLLLGAAVSVGLHGVLLAALGGLSARLPAGDGGVRPPLEVVALSPDQVRALLEPAPLPVVLEVSEAPRVHAPEATPWPRTTPAPAPLPEALPFDLPAASTPLAPALASAVPRADVPELPEVWVEAAPAAATAAADAEATPPTTEAAAVAVSAAAEDATPPPAGSLVRTRVHPTYPRRALDRGVEGVVTVAMRVAEDGSVERAWVLRTSGSRLLDRAAVDALSRWRFDAAAVRALGRGRVFSEDVRFSVR